MVAVAKISLEFILVFLLVYIVTYLFSYKKNDKFNRKKMPLGIKYLVFRYKLDIVRIGYKRIIKTLMLCDSFIISLLFVLTRIIDNVYIRLLVAFILVFPFFVGVYHMIAIYYIKESE